MRRMGDITLDLEVLLQEMVHDHDLQMGEVLALVSAWIEIHAPECIEEYEDGSHPIRFYGHVDSLSSMKKKAITVKENNNED